MLILTRFTLHPSLSLARVASHLPFNYTGADFYALCSDAMLKAVNRQAARVDDKIKALNRQRSSGQISTAYFFDHYATNEDVAVTVKEEDFAGAMRELIPSVSAKELAHYQRVRAQFEQSDAQETNGTLRAAHVDTRPGKSVEEQVRKDESRTLLANGHSNVKSKSKGKGKANESTSLVYQEATASDDEELY